MQFNIKDYTGVKCCMHCDTLEKAHVFLKYLHSQGLCWQSGSSYIDYDNYDKYLHDTCYYFNDGMFGSFDFADVTKITILNFDDFDWGDETPVRMSFEEFFLGNKTTI